MSTFDLGKAEEDVRRYSARKHQLAALGERVLASIKRHDDDCALGLIDCTEERLRITRDAIKAAQELGLLEVPK